MQSDTYWSKRLQELDASLSKDEKQLFSELSKYYEQEYAALDKEIAAYYAKYGEENVIAFRTLLLELPDADKQLLLQNMDEFAKQYPEFAELLPVRESIYKLNRLEGLQTSSVLQQLKIGAIEQTKFREHFEKQVLKYANYAAEKLGFGTNFYRIDSEMLQVVIGNPWCNGKDFSERIWANREALAQTLQNEIANGLIRGEDYRTMSRILQQKFENTSQKQAERLVFTEDTYLSNEAKIRPFERNAAYTHYEYLCVEDHRTCETCRALSGQTFEISKRNAGLNFPPMHPWCRCTVLPVVENLATIKRRLNADSGSGKSDAILLTDTQKDGIIKTDERFEIHPDKIKKFLLKPGAKHSKEFFDVGYTPDDYELLFDDIALNFNMETAFARIEKPDGSIDFCMYMDLGVTKKRNFKVVWKKDNSESKPRLITAHREGKKHV